MRTEDCHNLKKCAVHQQQLYILTKVQDTPVTQMTFLLKDLDHFLCSSFALFGITIM